MHNYLTAFFGTHPYLSIALSAFLVNIPLGYIREACPKFSLKWFFWIHASIPLIIYLRITLHTSKLFIPLAIAFAVLGQILGSRYRRSKMTDADIEKLEQISDLGIFKKAQPGIDDSQIAVLLLNMGGPENLTEVRPFLKRLFCDRRLMRFPLSAFLQPFFAWLIVSIRGKEAERRYGIIGGRSPILKATRNQAEALKNELKKRNRDIGVEICFNYSRPFARETIVKLKNDGKKYVLALSLYPHYSAATTGSSHYYLKEEVRRHYPQAILWEARPYYLDDNYIAAFVDRIQEQLKPGESPDDFYLLFSAHGLPLYFLNEGDPYPFQIAQTVSKIIDRLKRKDRWTISYQSAVGPLEWLKPSTESVIRALAKRGEKKLFVVPISFVTDHIETLLEIDIEYHAVAEKLGIKDFRMSRAIASHPVFIKALADCVESSIEIKGDCIH